MSPTLAFLVAEFSLDEAWLRFGNIALLALGWGVPILTLVLIIMMVRRVRHVPKYMKQQAEHAQRTEQLLERIATALEKKQDKPE